jgi:8-oxo-dGTP diphosphatase
MQDIYEIILGSPMDKRNFRKKVLSLGIIKKTKKVRSGEKSRPAALYTFAKKRVEMIDIL